MSETDTVYTIIWVVTLLALVWLVVHSSTTPPPNGGA